MKIKDIAIIAYSGIFPGADSVEAFAQNLKTGKTTIDLLSEKRLLETTIPRDASYSKSGYLEEITFFDHRFFNISLGEAEEITPHQRLLLQEAYKTFEKAHYRPSDLKGSNTSVYVGDAPTDYFNLARKASPSLIAGNMKSINASRISRFFDLRGAAMSVDTTCSSTLTALSLACKDLTLEQTDLALVCGVNIFVFPPLLNDEVSMGIESLSQQCSPFSTQADGTLPGEVVACVLLKDLDKALADGDNIHGVIKGFGLNQDGALSSSITAPSSESQQLAIQKALRHADVDPREVAFVEAHGTGTKLGDPIEIEGLSESYGVHLKEEERLYLSAVKSNVGHTDSAAGLVGVIKVLLSFKENILFPSVNALPYNELIDFEAARVKVLTEPMSWEEVGRSERKIAGVSSFGLMGTNVHIILEDHPSDRAEEERVENNSSQHFFCFSAKSMSSLTNYVRSFASFAKQTDASLSMLSNSLNTSRDWYDLRYLVSATSKAELLEKLNGFDPGKVQQTTSDERIILLFDDAKLMEEQEIALLKKQVPALNIRKLQNQSAAGRSLLLQYAFYERLVASGVTVPDMIGQGIGKLLIKVLKDEMTLEQALEKASEAPVTKRSKVVFREKALKLIKNSREKIRFVSMGYKDVLAEVFEELAENGLCHFNHFGYDPKGALHDCVECLAEIDFKVDVRKLYEGMEQPRCVLPTYVFDKTRCWLRTVDDPFHPATQYPEVTASAASDSGEIQSDLPLVVQMQKLWEEVLKMEVAEQDDFFEIGGHSLNGQRLVNRLNELFEGDFELDVLFDNGTPAEMAAFLEAEQIGRRATVAPEKTKLSKVQPISPKAHAAHPKVSLAPIQESYPISDAQRRMWILSQFDEGSLAYNIPNTTELKGAYDPTLFKKAIHAVIDRHEILRTVFVEEANGSVRQKIQTREQLGFQVAVIDLRAAENPSQQLEAYLQEDYYKAFDLEKGPLLRACLFQMADDHYQFYYNMHHIISDGWSLGVLAKDVLAYYESYQRAVPPSLPKLPFQYKDYASWQQKQLSGVLAEQHKAYWLNQFSGVLPVLDLPGQQARPKVKTNNGHTLRTFISPETTQQLRDFNQRQGGSLFMTLLAAWNVLLYRYSGQDDLIIASPIAGRNLLELENQIGCYINTLAFRNQIQPTDSFVDFYQRVKATATAAYTHQDYPFDRLVEDLNLQRDTSRSALFDVMLELQTATEKVDATQLKPEEVVKIYDAGKTFSRFDLEIDLVDIGAFLTFHINYNTDIYERATIEKMMQHFRQILAALLVQPEKQVAAVNYLSTEEQKLLLQTFNDTRTAYPSNQNVLDLFAKQVAERPDQIALVFGQQRLTYRELEEQSNRLALYLKVVHEVQTDTLVGIHLSRSEWLIVAILGVLKSGAAYIPMDIEYPEERIAAILEDSQCRLMIDDRWLYLYREADFDVRADLPAIAQEDLAYVIYTSGSTGRPKGVLIQHSALADYAQTARDYFQMTAEDSMLQQASISFDTSIEEIFPILTAGGTLIVVEDRRDLEGLFDLCVKEKVSLLSTNPFAVAYLNDHIHEYQLSLRVLISGGDSLKFEYVDRLMGQFDLYNTYGPTESTVCATYYKIESSHRNLPIGRPIANREVYILDAANGLLPIGMAGELCLAGAGLAKGYLNRPDLTAEKFVAHPFKAGERLYRTGDLARWLPDGNIEFLGRSDDQVKIRGFRIELGEIEYHLLAHPDIQQAVVCALGASENKYLVAYYTSDVSLDEELLKEHLAEILPTYMQPAHCVLLDHIPLNANGKADKKVLPIPERRAGADHVAAANSTEEKVVDIWAEILKVDREVISVTKSFFELGGHSLRAVTLVSRIEKEFGVKIKLQSIFSKPTVRELARSILLLGVVLQAEEETSHVVTI
ncbi:MAG: amino acid adenylation domain-containing protein [Bacteroidota bacterium]